MRTTVLHVCLCAFGVGVPAATQSPARCDRACLEGLLDRDVDALVARDPSRLPAAGTVTFTENGQRLELGDGLWYTVTGKGGYVLPITDGEGAQAVFMGTIREAGVSSVFVLRLKAVDRKITEVETLVIRNLTRRSRSVPQSVPMGWSRSACSGLRNVLRHMA